MKETQKRPRKLWGVFLLSGEVRILSFCQRYRIFYIDSNIIAQSITLVGNVTSYDWVVPDVAAEEGGKKIRITSYAGSTMMNTIWMPGRFSIGP